MSAKKAKLARKENPVEVKEVQPVQVVRVMKTVSQDFIVKEGKAEPVGPSCFTQTHNAPVGVGHVFLFRRGSKDAPLEAIFQKSGTPSVEGKFFDPSGKRGKFGVIPVRI